MVQCSPKNNIEQKANIYQISLVENPELVNAESNSIWNSISAPEYNVSILKDQDVRQIKVFKNSIQTGTIDIDSYSPFPKISKSSDTYDYWVALDNQSLHQKNSYGHIGVSFSKNQDDSPQTQLCIFSANGNLTYKSKLKANKRYLEFTISPTGEYVIAHSEPILDEHETLVHPSSIDIYNVKTGEIDISKLNHENIFNSRLGVFIGEFTYAVTTGSNNNWTYLIIDLRNRAYYTIKSTIAYHELRHTNQTFYARNKESIYDITPSLLKEIF